MSTENPQRDSRDSRAGDGSTVTRDSQKLSVAEFGKEYITDGLLVDYSDEQLVVSSRPRPGVGVSVALECDATHDELTDAVDDVVREVQHLRAIAGDGATDLADLGRGVDDVVRVPVVDRRTVSLETLLAEVDDPDVSYEVRSALARLQAALVEGETDA